ncbi:hypothetical protein GALL_41640 [mine drainage metagenome]|uniref:Salt-induced outer membrane protein n=1 Tax=mine drainage metagenome TaxID=410659 RepID=A0A1J5TFC3_9ZZZZ
MFRAQYSLLLFLLSSTLCLATQLSEIQLKNGDRLTGEIVSQDTRQVVVNSPFLGKITVPRDQILKMELSKAPATKPAAHGPQNTTAVALVSGATGGSSTRAALERILRGTKGSMEFGFNQQSGRSDSVNATVRADAEYQQGIDTYELTMQYYYGRYDGSVQADQHETSFRWRHELKSKRFFAQSNTSYSVDHVKLVNLDLEQSAGIGLRAIKSEKQTLNLGSGLTGQYRRAYGEGTNALALGDLFEDYLFKFNDRVNLKQSASVQYSPISNQSITLINGKQSAANDQATNYSLRFNVALQSKLTHRITLNLHYDLAYDNAIYDPSLKTDQRISSTIGYAF